MLNPRLKSIIRALHRERFFLIASLTLVVISIGSVGVYFFEKEAVSNINSVWDGVWWAFVTICTVGYGDKYPVSVGGKIIGIFLMISGIGLLSMLTATVASVLVEQKIREGKGLEAVKEKEHVIVCGWNNHTEEVISGVIKTNPNTSIALVNELSIDEIDSLKSKYEGFNIAFLRGNFVHEEALLRANVAKAKSVVIMADFSGSHLKERADDRTILAALTIRSLAPRVRTVAELLDSENVSHLSRAKVDEVIVRGENAGALLANAIDSPGLSRVISEMVSHNGGSKLKRLRIPERFVGKRLEEYASYERKKTGSLLIGLVQEKRTVKIDDILSDDSSAIDVFIRERLRESGKNYLKKEEPRKILLNPGEDYILKSDDFAIVITSGAANG